MAIRGEIPEAMCVEFETQICAFREFYKNGLEAFSGTAHEGRDASVLSEAVFFQSCVALEEFISFYFAGCVARDATRLLQSRERSIRQYLRDRWEWDSPHIVYELPKSTSFEDACTLLDRDGENLTFRDCELMLERAKEYLPPKYSARFNRIPGDCLVAVDAARAIRNCLAHKSRKSLHQMKAQLESLPEEGAVAVFKAKVTSVEHVGAYLKASPRGRSRVDLYLDEFQTLARALTLIEA